MSNDLRQFLNPSPIIQLTNINGPCPASKSGHTLEWKNDNKAVCRHCGGVYVP